MQSAFIDNLTKAQGRSEFVIVVNADIRGFSAFSTVNESPNIAMFIKRFYHQMVTAYFPNANFVKPTGDGLLMTFPYDEESLLEVSAKVLTACLECLKDFPTICKDDPMINFEVPSLIGFGVARGTACCLHADELILDYSGHLLNLASRLMELARPSGIVIDGNYSKVIIPARIRDRFAEQRVFLRGIAEENPTAVLYLKDYVEIPEFYLSALLIEKWLTIDQTYSVAQWKKFGHYEMDLESKIKSAEKIKLTLIYPKKGLKGHEIHVDSGRDCYSVKEEPTPSVTVNLEKILKLAPDVLPKTAQVCIRVAYVPRPLART